MPKGARTPQLPNATPTHIIEDLLTVAVIEPTLGCRQYADRLAERGYTIGKTTVLKHLVDHGLGRRSQRVLGPRRSPPRRPGYPPTLRASQNHSGSATTAQRLGP